MKHSLEQCLLPELPHEIWILFGESLGEDYQSLSRFMRVRDSFNSDPTLAKILMERKLEIICVLCRIRKGVIHSNCLLGGECRSSDDERRRNAFCRVCVKDKCDWCDRGNCGCHDMQESCQECDLLFCEYCQNDYNVLRLDDWPILCRWCRPWQNGLP